MQTLKQILVALLIFFSLSLACRIAAADQVAFKYGLGVLLPETGKPNVKVFSLSKQDYLGFGTTEQFELGGYTDSAGDGRKASAFGFYSLGITIDAHPFRLQSLWGAGIITQPDTRLSGLFQFTHDLCFSLYNTSNESIGVGYKHISNAGLSSPNKGRDFITMRMAWNL